MFREVQKTAKFFFLPGGPHRPATATGVLAGSMAAIYTSSSSTPHRPCPRSPNRLHCHHPHPPPPGPYPALTNKHTPSSATLAGNGVFVTPHRSRFCEPFDFKQQH